MSSIYYVLGSHHKVITKTKTGYVCPICDKKIAKNRTKLSSAFGLLAMHIKWKHGDGCRH